MQQSFFERMDPYLELKRSLRPFINFYPKVKTIETHIVYRCDLFTDEETKNKKQNSSEKQLFVSRMYYPVCRLYYMERVQKKEEVEHLSDTLPSFYPQEVCLLQTKTPCKDDLGCKHRSRIWEQPEDLPPFLSTLTQHLLADYLISLWRMPLKLNVCLIRERTLQKMIQQILHYSEGFLSEHAKVLDTFVIRESFLQLCPVQERFHWIDDYYAVTTLFVQYKDIWITVSVLIIRDDGLTYSCELSVHDGLNTVLPHDQVIAWNSEQCPEFRVKYRDAIPTVSDGDRNKRKENDLNFGSWLSCMFVPFKHVLWVSTTPYSSLHPDRSQFISHSSRRHSTLPQREFTVLQENADACLSAPSSYNALSPPPVSNTNTNTKAKAKKKVRPQQKRNSTTGSRRQSRK